eukprot:6456736-Amphidinium_carterae.2
MQSLRLQYAHVFTSLPAKQQTGNYYRKEPLLKFYICSYSLLKTTVCDVFNCNTLGGKSWPLAKDLTHCSLSPKPSSVLEACMV